MGALGEYHYFMRGSVWTVGHKSPYLCSFYAFHANGIIDYFQNWLWAFGFCNIECYWYQNEKSVFCLSYSHSVLQLLSGLSICLSVSVYISNVAAAVCIITQKSTVLCRYHLSCCLSYIRLMLQLLPLSFCLSHRHLMLQLLAFCLPLIYIFNVSAIVTVVFMLELKNSAAVISS